MRCSLGSLLRLVDAVLEAAQAYHPCLGFASCCTYCYDPIRFGFIIIAKHEKLNAG
jgi:hypothetical protein